MACLRWKGGIICCTSASFFTPYTVLSISSGLFGLFPHEHSWWIQTRWKQALSFVCWFNFCQNSSLHPIWLLQLPMSCPVLSPLLHRRAIVAAFYSLSGVCVCVSMWCVSFLAHLHSLKDRYLVSSLLLAAILPNLHSPNFSTGMVNQDLQIESHLNSTSHASAWPLSLNVVCWQPMLFSWGGTGQPLLLCDSASVKFTSVSFSCCPFALDLIGFARQSLDSGGGLQASLKSCQKLPLCPGEAVLRAPRQTFQGQGWPHHWWW